MDWKTIIGELQLRGYTLEQIASECGFASRGAVHDLKNGRQKTSDFDKGFRMVELHKRAMRRKAKR